MSTRLFDACREHLVSVRAYVDGESQIMIDSSRQSYGPKLADGWLNSFLLVQK